MKDRLSHTYSAIAHPTRRDILRSLRAGSARITDLAEPFDLSFNTVSKHVRQLEGAGLIVRRVEGRDHYLMADPTPLRPASDWIADYCAFWANRMDALDAFIRRRDAE